MFCSMHLSRGLARNCPKLKQRVATPEPTICPRSNSSAVVAGQSFICQKCPTFSFHLQCSLFPVSSFQTQLIESLDCLVLGMEVWFSFWANLLFSCGLAWHFMMISVLISTKFFNCIFTFIGYEPWKMIRKSVF